MRTVTRYFERLINHDLTFKILARLRVNYYTKLEPLTSIILQNYRQADILNRFVTDIDTLDHLYLRLIIPFGSAVISCFFMVSLTLIFSEAPKLSIALTIIFIVTLIVIPPFLYLLSNKTSMAISDNISHLRVRIFNYIRGYTDLIINNAEAEFKLALIKEEEKLHRLEGRMASLSGLSNGIITITGAMALLTTLYFSAVSVHQNLITGPIAAMLVLAVMAVFEAIMPLPLAVNMLGKVKRSATRINEIVEKKTSVVFPTDKSRQNDISPTPASLHFIDLCYQYPCTVSPAIQQLNLHIQPGEKVAITGHTGCGKSTLFNLLTRMDNPASGKILINDTSIENFSEPALRHSMSVMPQHIHIFSASLRDNLLLANPAACDDDLIDLLRSLDFSGSKKEMTELLQTHVGDSGRTLSGGEIRRIGMARVLLQVAPVILLDEPSEGLDAITESRVFNTLNAKCHNSTLLVMTHKPAILAYMDRVISWEDLIIAH